ncbi:nuclear factor 7, brain isoform X1 [Esox lucius]|uniref:Zinc-binding protein A33-like n=1 Tax=Esox lucius TaxID=8010 RepID=A0AAY5K3A6_ESOLU|nr:nuclear factor 7, brain isoform X1 [Esox lucius]
MASRFSFPEEDLFCPVCRDIFKDPVVLSCSHSFCKSCVQKCWKLKGFRECPVCRRRSSKSEPPCNRALKNLCESFLQQRHQRAPVLQRPAVLCSQHNEKLQLFCLEDKQPICLVCQASKTHRSHQCVPINDALKNHKNQLQTALKHLHEKLKMFTEVQQTYDQTTEHIKSQAQHTEEKIKTAFEKLHQFLRDDEAARIASLRREAEQKSQMMKKNIEQMSKDMSSLSNTIQATEEELRAEEVSFLQVRTWLGHCVSLSNMNVFILLQHYTLTQNMFSYHVLQNFKATMKKATCALADPERVSGTLIDVAKHLGNLQFRVWEKMQEIVTHTPVILDPNTAHACLSVSGDLTSVRYLDPLQKLPDNPERFMYSKTVLGSEGFSSGTHSWEVAVGDHPLWNVGVVKKSTDRRKGIHLTPAHGMWAIKHRSGTYKALEDIDMALKRSPQRIRVQLDYDRGEISFYDPKDMTLLFKHRDTFTERLYPLLSVGPPGDAINLDLQICHRFLRR